MPNRPLSEAELQQRRDAARARWSQAVGGAALTAGLASGAYGAASAFTAPRRPTKEEVKGTFLRVARQELNHMRRAGETLKDRSWATVATRRQVMDGIAHRLRPVSNRRAKIASAVAGGLLGAGLTAHRMVNEQPTMDRINRIAGSGALWAATGLGVAGGLREALTSHGIPHKPIPRSAMAAGGAGLALIGAYRAARKEA